MRRLLVVCVAAAMTLSACGGSSNDDAAVDAAGILAASATKTIEAGSAKIDMVMELAQGSMTASGAFEFGAKRGSMTMDLGALLAASGAPAGSDTTAQIILDGATIYMKMALLSAFAPEGSSGWFKMDLAAVGADFGLDLSQFSQGDPSQYLAMLRGATSDGVTTVGTEDVRGVSTTHYKATVDLRAAMESSGAATDPEALQKLIDQLGTETQEMEVWVDGDGLVRRSRTSFAGATAEMSGTVTVELYDYGQPVEIDIPTDATDLAELMGGAGAPAG